MYSLGKIFLISLLTLFTGCSLFSSDENLETFDTQRFPEPAGAPFELSLDFEPIQQSGQKMINLQLNVHNPDTTPLGLATLGFSRTGNYFEFVVTRQDHGIIWNLIQTDVLFSSEARLVLEAGETRTFEHNWDLTDNRGRRVEPGNYLLFGGMWSVSRYEDTTLTGEPIKEFGNIGVGENPTELTIEE